MQTSFLINSRARLIKYCTDNCCCRCNDCYCYCFCHNPTSFAFLFINCTITWFANELLLSPDSGLIMLEPTSVFSIPVTSFSDLSVLLLVNKCRYNCCCRHNNCYCYCFSHIRLHLPFLIVPISLSDLVSMPFVFLTVPGGRPRVLSNVPTVQSFLTFLTPVVNAISYHSFLHSRHHFI